MVNVDTVYQRVLALANKEQRGYITPQEFNLFANQAQMDMFEQYFYEMNQSLRIPGNNAEHADMLTILEEKISIFEAEVPVSYNDTLGAYDAQVPDMYRMSTVRYDLDGKSLLAEKVSEKELRMMVLSPLTKPTSQRPIYVSKNNILKLYPATEDSITINYIREPNNVIWSNYVVSSTELYDSTNSVNFELHPSEETKLVIKILSLAGITLKDPSLYQVAEQQDNKNAQQEKQQ